MRVIGVGNILLCDEGIGVHVVRALSSRWDMPGVDPERILLGVVPADAETYSLELSAPLAARFAVIVEKVRSEIATFAASPRP